MTDDARSPASPGKPGFGWVCSAVDRFQGPLCRYAARILGGDEDRARDVVQETFVRLCRQSPAAVDGHLAEWLFTVCRNQALDIRRKQRRLSELDESAPMEQSAEPDPARQAERGELAQRAMELLAGLPERQQEVVRLKFQAGLRYGEIAAVTGLTASYVGVLIHTAVKALRRQMTGAMP